jgi:ribokinase
MCELSSLAIGRPISLLTFGAPVVDLIVSIGQIPEWDEKVVGKLLGTFAGGTTANVACAASRLGLRTSAFGDVGDDGYGKFLVNEYRRFGVATGYLRILPNSVSAMSVIMVAPFGEKAITYLPIRNVETDYGTLAAVLRQSCIVYAMPYDLDEFRTVSQLAHCAGTHVAIDIESAVAPDGERMRALLELSDIVFFNERGFQTATGKAPSHEAMRPLLKRGPHTIVVTRGAAGALAVSQGDAAQHPAFPAEVVDATGAGDGFNAAFVAALIERRALADALRFACAVAHFAVGAIGGRDGLPDRETVNAFLYENA